MIDELSSTICNLFRLYCFFIRYESRLIISWVHDLIYVSMPTRFFATLEHDGFADRHIVKEPEVVTVVSCQH